MVAHWITTLPEALKLMHMVSFATVNSVHVPSLLTARAAQHCSPLLIVNIRVTARGLNIPAINVYVVRSLAPRTLTYTTVNDWSAPCSAC